MVDDEEYVRDLGKRILERAGYTVITASNGKEALEIYAREQSNIGLVVLDLIMPQMGGEKCLEELLKINPKMKVVVSSGHSLDPKETRPPQCLCERLCQQALSDEGIHGGRRAELWTRNELFFPAKRQRYTPKSKF